MKHLLFAVFENCDKTTKLINVLSKKEINATAIASTSLKHIFNAMEEDTHFFTLRHFEETTFEDNTTFYALLEEDILKEAQEIIRKETDNFKKIKGGMFVLPIESYEGTF